MILEKFSLLNCCLLDKGNVLYAELRDELHVDITTAIKLVQARVEFMDDHMHYMIADVSKVKSVTAEAKEYLRSPDGGMRNLLGAALLAANPVSALIANFFIKVNKDFQARYFSDRQNAIDWIRHLAEKNPVLLRNNSPLTIHHP
jgi:hypothetical protein